MIGVMILWAVLPVLMFGLLFLTAHPLPTNQRVGVAAFWCIVMGLSAPYTLGMARFFDGWLRTAVWWGVFVVCALSVFWGVVLVFPPKRRPPTGPGKPSGNFVAAQSRTYRWQGRRMW